MKSFSTTTESAKANVSRIVKRLAYVNCTVKRLERDANRARFEPFKAERLWRKFEHKLEVEQALRQVKRGYEAIYSDEYSKEQKVRITLSFFIESKKYYQKTVKEAPKTNPKKRMVLWTK